MSMAKFTANYTLAFGISCPLIARKHSIFTKHVHGAGVSRCHAWRKNINQVAVLKFLTFGRSESKQMAGL